MRINPVRLLLASSVSSLLLISSLAAEEYRETVLENGLRVVTITRPEVPMVALTTIVGAGSALITAAALVLPASWAPLVIAGLLFGAEVGWARRREAVRA